MSRDDRQKESDIFNKGNPAYTTKGSFENVFPEIEKLDIIVEFQGCGIDFLKDKKNISHYNIETLHGEYIDCINPLCGGGFSIGSILREMGRTKETNKEVIKMCQGYEGSPKGKIKYGKCVNRFIVKINIKYKDQAIKE